MSLGMRIGHLIFRFPIVVDENGVTLMWNDKLGPPAKWIIKLQSLSVKAVKLIVGDPESAANVVINIFTAGTGSLTKMARPPTTI